MDEGKIVLLDFWANWRTTSAVQECFLCTTKIEDDPH